MMKSREGIAASSFQAQWLFNLTLVLFFLVSTLLEGVPFLRLGERPDKKYKEIQPLW